MSDTNATVTPTTTVADTTATTTATTGEKTSQWYEAELSKVRDEAAGHRVGKKEAVEAAKAEAATEWQAKLDEAAKQHETTQSELAKAQLELAKVLAAVGDQKDYVVKFASLLQGESVEEIDTHAETVRELFSGSTSPKPAVDKTPASKTVALNGDPIEDMLKNALGIN
jgi:hypothetical protein